MNFGGTRALVMIPALLLIMSDLWQGIFPLCLFLIYKIQTIHLPCCDEDCIKSRDRTIMSHATHNESLGSVSLPGFHLVGRGGERNIERKHSVCFHYS